MDSQRYSVRRKARKEDKGQSRRTNEKETEADRLEPHHAAVTSNASYPSATNVLRILSPKPPALLSVTSFFTKVLV